jgi:hypothetical protein
VGRHLQRAGRAIVLAHLDSKEDSRNSGELTWAVCKISYDDLARERERKEVKK